MQDMYPAIVNSPDVVIRGALTSSTTEIEVSDSGVFSSVSLPIPLTLGKGSTAETVLLTAINGEILTVTRGFQGSPRSWEAGTLISRNFTAYDHDAFKANIEEINNSMPVNASNEVYGLVRGGTDISITNGEMSVNKAVLADSATKLTTSRTIALTGDATGSGLFNGTAKLSIETTVNNSAKVNNIQFRLGEKGIEYSVDGEIWVSVGGGGDVSNLIYEQTLTQGISDLSIDWAMRMSEDLGVVMADSFNIDSGDLRACKSLGTVAASETAMAAVAASETAMAAVAASETAMAAVAASETAMAAVAASETAMAAVIASETAMAAVAASETAMAAVIASETAMAAVAASETAMGAFWANSSALNTLYNSNIARDAMRNSPALQIFQTNSTTATQIKTGKIVIVDAHEGTATTGNFTLGGLAGGRPGTDSPWINTVAGTVSGINSNITAINDSRLPASGTSFFLWTAENGTMLSSTTTTTRWLSYLIAK